MGDKSNMVPDLIRMIGNWPAPYFDATTCWLQKRGHYTHEGSLACPIWSNQCYKFTWLDMEIHTSEHHIVAVALYQSFYLNHGLFSINQPLIDLTAYVLIGPDSD
jgi:hypothetical protein